jgi:hypothetical protein
VIRHDDATMRLGNLPENNMAASLAVFLIAHFSQGFDDITTGDAREHAHA